MRRKWHWYILQLPWKNDKTILGRLADGTYAIQSFDYDGKKYTREDSQSILVQLGIQIKACNELIRQNDQAIYTSFLQLAHAFGKVDSYNAHYKNFLSIDKEYNERMGVYTEMASAISFMQYTTPFEQIEENMKTVKEKEQKFKKALQEAMEDQLLDSVITEENRAHFSEYLSKDWLYFNVDEYYEEALQVMYRALEDYAQMMSQSYFNIKKALLDYKVYLFEMNLGKQAEDIVA